MNDKKENAEMGEEREIGLEKINAEQLTDVAGGDGNRRVRYYTVICIRCGTPYCGLIEPKDIHAELEIAMRKKCKGCGVIGRAAIDPVFYEHTPRD